jgi:hypothetical protein
MPSLFFFLEKSIPHRYFIRTTFNPGCLLSPLDYLEGKTALLSEGMEQWRVVVALLRKTSVRFIHHGMVL